MVRIEEGDNWYDMKGGGEYRVGQRKSRGRQPFMIGMEEPTQWKKRWESIIREDNAIICTCLWTTLNTTNCSFSIIIPPPPPPLPLLQLPRAFPPPFLIHFPICFYLQDKCVTFMLPISDILSILTLSLSLFLFLFPFFVFLSA